MATIDDKIGAIEFYVEQRQLGIALVLAQSFVSNRCGDPLAQSGFAILSVVFSYFEMTAQFMSGMGSDHGSKLFFRDGFKNVFPTSPLSDGEIDDVYIWVRCGMYHGAMPKNEVHVSREIGEAFRKDSDRLIINPARLVEDLQCHFRQYVCRLRSPANVTERENFERMFDLVKAMSPIGPSASYSTRTRTTLPPWKID